MTLPVQPGEADARIPFVLKLASALHSSGHASHRLEEALEATSDHLGLTGQYFATPTSIFASFGTALMQRTFMIRTEPMPPDLGRLVRVTEIARSVLLGAQSPEEGTRQLVRLEQAPSRPGLWTVLAFSLASGAAARFLGGGAREVIVAAVIGLAVGLLAVIAARLANLGRVFELAAATLSSFGVAAIAAAVGGVSVPIATLAGLIVLVPGLTLTTAIAELATRQLTAGTTRMAGAFMTFIGIGFGVALGSRLATAVLGPVTSVAPVALAPGTIWLALVVSAAAFTLLLKADRRDAPWILGAGTLAFVATRAGSALLGPELGVFVGALALGLGSNLFNRLTNRPSAVTLVPGLLTLVPGSVGFRSVSALMESQVVAGVDAAFSMVLTAVSLVAGLLAAAAVYPERPLTASDP
ncbi:MAG: threonine/serine exporter family protein [Gemmatimonadetes bacterium]|nr:threonine/serine exporter family protein [Gemmatimonadota bacterium]